MHWYSLAGEARHEQPTKKGAKNPTRATNLKDAQEQNLLPSVSGITKVWANPALDYYKVTQAAKAAYRKPPIGPENEEEYVAMIYAESQQDAATAADNGTIIHKALEEWLTESKAPSGGILVGDKYVPLQEFIDPAIIALGKLGIEVTASEKVLVNAKDGYAGTTDVIWERVLWVDNESIPTSRGILDFKSKRTKPGKPIEPNQDHPLQIAAYHVAAHNVLLPTDLGYNVYISTTEPGRVEVKEWTAKELREAWDAFQHCLALWRYQTGYDPRKNT